MITKEMGEWQDKIEKEIAELKVRMKKLEEDSEWEELAINK